MKPTPFFDLLPSPGNTRTMLYAGVGSRNTPPDMIRLMAKSAIRLKQLGYHLMTGDADGADSAFRSAIDDCKSVFSAQDATERTRLIAKEIHPAPFALRGKPLDLIARNTFQIFGPDLNTTVDFVLTWTPDGMEHYSQRTRESGGTGQAIAMASMKGIPVFNMKRADWALRLKSFLNP